MLSARQIARTDLPDPFMKQVQIDEKNRRLRAIFLMCGAVVVFSCLDATAKYLVGIADLPVSETIWLRFVGHVCLAVLFFGPRNSRALLKSNRRFHQWFRAALMLGATAFNFAAVKYLRLDQTVTVFFITPLIVAALAGPILNEWIGWRRLAAIATGFLGVILVVRPGLGGIHWAIVYSFAATLSFALYNIWTRWIAAHDPENVTQFYSPLAGFILVMPFALNDWVWPASPMIWFLLLALGFLGGVGHWLLIKAHQIAPAPILAPFIYIGLIAMTILGYVIFGDVPDAYTLGGASIIIFSGLYLLYRERREK